MSIALKSTTAVAIAATSLMLFVPPVATAESTAPNEVRSSTKSNANCKKLLDQQLRTCRAFPDGGRQGALLPPTPPTEHASSAAGYSHAGMQR
ncbi:hypothetical protein ACQX3D_12080 [Corynebacterium diphtheriae]